MKKRERGFILFMTLAIMVTMSLLLLTSMHHVLLYYRAMNQQELRHKNFYQLEHVAGELAARLKEIHGTNCFVSQVSANQVLEKLAYQQGCSITVANTEYRYLIDDFGEFPCCIVQQKNHYLATHHFSISVLEVGKNGYSDSILQLRLIKPVSTAKKCTGEQHYVNAGISSWRYFAEYVR